MINLAQKKKKSMTMEKDRKSDYVCVKCGVKYLTEKQKKQNNVCTFFLGTCALCNEKAAITHVRNYNYLKITNHGKEK